MKKYVIEFIRRGLTACSFGPIVLAIIYLALQNSGVVYSLTVNEVCLGIFSLAALAFVAGGMTAIYQIERLPLMPAIFIHGAVLYISYLLTYLLNGWLEQGMTPLLVFTAIFAGAYLLVWAIIYFTTKRSTEKLNEVLQKTAGRRNSEK